MDARYVKAVLEIARTGSMTVAATHLNISQSALSRQVQRIETELGIALFDRVGRGVRLSEAGEALRRHCTDFVQSESSLFETARQLRGGRLGNFSIGATPWTIERLIAPFLQTFRKDFPNVECKVVEAGGAKVIELIEAHEIRLGVAFIGPSPRLVQHPLVDLTLMAIRPQSRSSPSSGLKAMTIQQACTFPILALNETFGSRLLFDSACRIENLTPEIAFETSAPDAALAMAAAGEGLALLPSSVGLRGMDLGAVPLITHAGAALTLQLGAVHDPQRKDPGYLDAVISNLSTLARETVI